MSVTLPEKYFYTIGDVCKLTGVKPHVLRYWESQFKFLRPARRYSGHRKYTRRDMDVISKIKTLVVDKKYTLAGARREVGREMSGKLQPANSKKQPLSAIPVLRDIKNDIDACLVILGHEFQQELLDLK